MKKAWTRRLGWILACAFLAVFLIVPATVYTLLYLGWPPVIGNLTAARAMERYAAQIYPEWKADSHWAGYNLVSGSYYLTFSDEGAAHSLEYHSKSRTVTDEEREEALRTELDIDGVIRRGGLWVPDQHITMWGARWSPDAPEQAIVSVRVDFSGGAGEPLPDEAAMRERMAARAMAVYEVLAAHSPIHEFSVYYHHSGTEAKKGGMLWNIISVELADGESLTRDHILNGTLVTN